MKSEIKIDIDYPITASPVVFDANSDGIDELIITADKIYIFETLNFNLIKTFQARAPFASTPEILHIKKMELNLSSPARMTMSFTSSRLMPK
jgi:hypothetical protein